MNANVQSVGATQRPGGTTKWTKSNSTSKKAPNSPSTCGGIRRSRSIPARLADACKSRLGLCLWSAHADDTCLNVDATGGRLN